MLKAQTPHVMSCSCAENVRHILQDNVTHKRTHARTHAQTHTHTHTHTKKTCQISDLR